MDLTLGAIEKIEKLVLAANAIVHPSAEPDHLYYLRDPNGEFVRDNDDSLIIVADARPRAHEVDDMETFVRLVETYKEQDADPALILISNSRVEAVLDASTRRERIVWPLTRTEQWVIVGSQPSSMQTSRPQAQFIRFLRVDLAGCVPEELITLVRSLRFAKGDEGTREVGKSSESIAMSVKRAVTSGGADIPDEVTVKVALYEEWAKPEAVQQVRCALDVNLEDGTLSMQALAGEVYAASLTVRQQIREEIAERLAGAIVGLGTV